MNVYVAVDESNPSIPKDRIEYCVDCKLIELYKEFSPKFMELDENIHRVFAKYLSGRSHIYEFQIEDMLVSLGIDLRLKTSVYPVYDFDKESFARDTTNGFMTGHYNTNTLFCLIKEWREIYNHSGSPTIHENYSGYHMTGNIKLSAPKSFSYCTEFLASIKRSKFDEDLEIASLKCDVDPIIFL